VFSISDYILEHHPVIAKEMLRYASSGLAGISCLYDLVLLSAFLLTFAENISFYLYMVWLPIWLVTNGIKLVFRLLMWVGLILLVIHLVQRMRLGSGVSDMLDDTEIDEMINTKVERSLALASSLFKQAISNASLFVEQAQQSPLWKDLSQKISDL